MKERALDEILRLRCEKQAVVTAVEGVVKAERKEGGGERRLVGVGRQAGSGESVPVCRGALVYI